jgi:Phosphotransferase enzyme family
LLRIANGSACSVDPANRPEHNSSNCVRGGRHYSLQVQGDFRATALHPLRGGLEAAGVFRVRARLQGPARQWRPVQFVVKVVHEETRRELDLYCALQGTTAAALAPRLLSAVHTDAGALLFLEWVQPVQRWPWRDVSTAGLVLARVARLHQGRWALAPEAALQWDYDATLRQSGYATLEALEGVVRALGVGQFRGAVPMTRRLVEALPAIRGALLQASPPIWIHGDLHPGNVILRRGKAGVEPVLLDWARVRLGSPLEDVSAWVQSLGHWEPQARRYHDTLVRTYLAAQGLEPVLNRDFRRLYWVAGACNALSGALRYYLVARQRARTPTQRATALALVRKWLRLLRRADASWRAG